MPQNLSPSSSYASQIATRESLSLFEKLGTYPALITTFVNVFVALFTGAFREKASYGRYLNHTALRTLTRKLSVRQAHYLFPPTDDSYVTACKKRNFTPNSVVLQDGTRAHWVGSSKAAKVIINFHGGGYVLPADATHYEFMFQIVDAVKAQGKDVAVLFLSYDLAPGATYPRQLTQASALLSHVLNKLSIPPSSILLTGDSAGANLALALLSHISHPHPSVPALTVSEPLLGAVLISPWISFATNTPSFTSNKYKDCLGPVPLQAWSQSFLGSSPSDNYTEALNAPESWWEGLQVQGIFVVAGEDEVLVDVIKEFAVKLESGLGKGRVKSLVVKNEYHDQPNLDLGMGVKEKDESIQSREIKGWLRSKL